MPFLNFSEQVWFGFSPYKIITTSGGSMQLKKGEANILTTSLLLNIRLT